MYFFKLQNVVLQIAKCTYLSKLQNVVVKISKYIQQNDMENQYNAMKDVRLKKQFTAI